jgi:hypothetical protein
MLYGIQIRAHGWPRNDLNPIEHIWDMLDRRIQARESPLQSIRQLEAALRREHPQTITEPPL